MLAEADSLARAAAAVAAGGIIAYPTEAVYGLGCDPARLDAVERLIRLKGRDAGKGLILVAAGWRQLDPYLAPLPPALRRTVEATWPGPNTWILPARDRMRSSFCVMHCMKWYWMVFQQRCRS